jgi:hypothetical protein
LFRANWDLTPESIRAAATSVDKYKLRIATERAELVVTTAEIDDAEAPLILKEAARHWPDSRNRRPQNYTLQMKNTATAKPH